MVEKTIIIGSGPSGLSAALFAARSNLKPLLFEGEPPLTPGGQLRNSINIETYPGFSEGVSGNDLYDHMRDQCENAGTVIKTESVLSVKFSENPFVIETKNGNYNSHSVIIASGARSKTLGLPIESKLLNQGISTCAVCDGVLPFYKNQIVAVIGGGDSACEDSLFLANYASKVLLICRKDFLNASYVLRERVKNNIKIEVLPSLELIDVIGESSPEEIVLKSTKSDKKLNLKVVGVFYAIGSVPNTEFLQGTLSLDTDGYIRTSGSSKTNIEGVFACGEVQDAKYRQIATSVGSGCMAALDAVSWLNGKGLIKE